MFDKLFRWTPMYFALRWFAKRRYERFFLAALASENGCSPSDMAYVHRKARAARESVDGYFDEVTRFGRDSAIEALEAVLARV